MDWHIFILPLSAYCRRNTSIPFWEHSDWELPFLLLLRCYKHWSGWPNASAYPCPSTLSLSHLHLLLPDSDRLTLLTINFRTAFFAPSMLFFAQVRLTKRLHEFRSKHDFALPLAPPLTSLRPSHSRNTQKQNWIFQPFFVLFRRG